MTLSSECPFCKPDPARIVAEDDLTLIYEDGFPVAPGHTLVIPRRHVASLFLVSTDEQLALLAAINRAKAALAARYRPDGYNIGINDGPAAGQTVPHLHIHLIPRYSGDCADPRGGVRWVLPGKARYWK